MISIFLNYFHNKKNILAAFIQTHRWLLFFSAVLFVVLLGYVDLITGYEISLSIFYLLPITILAWYSGRNAAFLLSIISAIVWFAADFKSDVDKHFSILIWDTGVVLGYYLLISYFLSTIRKLYEHEKDLARIDPLTGAVNRRYFYILAENEIYRAKRFKRSLSLAFLDIDNFKMINDTLGHGIGDELLKTVTISIIENLRTSDVLARFGGDEFAILLPETGSKQVREVIDKVKKILMDVVRENHWPVSFSIGVVTAGERNYNIDDIIKTADELMYSVKKSGKNSIKYYSLSKGTSEKK